MKTRIASSPSHLFKLARLDLSAARQQTGATMVEFAIVAVLLFTIIMMIMQGGLVLGAWLTITNGAREGARYAAPCWNRSVEPCSVDDVRSVVIERTSVLVNQDTGFSVDVAGNNAEVVVTVKCAVDNFLPLPLPQDAFTLTGQSTMRIEN